MAKATSWTVTDAEAKAWCNRIRYPGSPRRKRWVLGVGSSLIRAAATH